MKYVLMSDCGTEMHIAVPADDNKKIKELHKKGLKITGRIKLNVDFDLKYVIAKGEKNND